MARATQPTGKIAPVRRRGIWKSTSSIISNTADLFELSTINLKQQLVATNAIDNLELVSELVEAGYDEARAKEIMTLS